MDLDPNDHPPVDRAVSATHPPDGDPLRVPTPDELRRLRVVDLTPRVDAVVRAAVKRLQESKGNELRATVHEELPVLEQAAARLRLAGWACRMEPGGFRDGGARHAMHVTDAGLTPSPGDGGL